MAPSKAPLTLLKDLRVSSYQIPSFDRFPNTSILEHLLRALNLIYQPSASYSRNGDIQCTGTAKHSRLVIHKLTEHHSTSHFHSTSHEVLCVAEGKAKLCFGHEDNPKRVEPTLEEGDVIVIPAGVSHRLLKDIKGGFRMVGSYPKGCSWDMCYGREGEEDCVKGIESLGWFNRDPIYGDQGPALNV